MNFVLFFLVGAGINSLTLGLTCLLLGVIKNRLTRRGVAVVMFIISAIVTIAISMYINVSIPYRVHVIIVSTDERDFTGKFQFLIGFM